jgi:hypothetical protein
MTREELLNIFQVDENDIIQNDGPLRGQPLYIAYYWYLFITGYTESLVDNILMYRVRIEDRVQFQELTEREKVQLKRNADGRIVEVFEQ